MRVTDNMRYNTTINSFFKTQAQYNDIIEKSASQKKINRASDDPIAATKIIDINQNLAANEQYRKNMTSIDSLISTSESKLSSAFDLLVRAQEIAVGQATATASTSTRKIAAQNVQSIIDEMLNLANSKVNDRYLFSGSRNDVEPFSTTLLSPQIEAAGKAANNTFAGTVVSSGTYTGTTNKNYALKITTAGALAAAEYQYSTDGGKTWNGTDLSLAGGSVSLGTGVTLTFDDIGGTKPFGADDIFYVNATAAGYYRGNNETLSITINRGMTLDYNTSGAETFTTSGANVVDVFATLNDLKTALDSNDVTGISNQLDNLKDAQSQVTLSQSLCGAKSDHIETAKNNLDILDENLNSLLSATQDADLAELATKLSMKELALKMSYAISAKIGETTILDFL